MMEEDRTHLPVSTASSPPTQRNSRLWIWIGVIVLIVIPVLSCAALGIGLALMVNPSASGTAASFGPSVGVIEVSGTILSGESGGFSGVGAGSDTIIDLIEQAADDDSIRAVVLRVDSPGGGVVASDEIHHALQQLNKPVVVSMGSMAASGGYFISAPADYIYATPNTLTGSIGVISQFFVAEEFLDDVGIDVIVVTAGDVKDFGSFHRGMTEEERAYWQELINQTHEDFIEVVAEGRGMDIEDVRQLADGRVFRGEQALDLGLVDEIGYFQDAVRKAAELGGIDGEPNVVELKPTVGFWDSLYGFQANRQSLDLDVILRDLSLPSLEFRWLGH